jgi:PBP1b-binding outer membrane lipoprotein LpoB
MKRYTSLLLCIPIVLLVAGCEPDDDEVRGELPVTPAATTLTGDEKTVILTADVTVNGAAPEPIVYPLEWSVSAPGVGRIVTQSADKAAYTHTAASAAVNTVTVRDGLGREGLATIAWEPGTGTE